MLHGGYTLVQYDHDEKRGVGVFTYERENGGAPNPVTVERHEPTSCKSMRPVARRLWAQDVLERSAAQGRTRDEMICDALFINAIRLN